MIIWNTAFNVSKFRRKRREKAAYLPVPSAVGRGEDGVGRGNDLALRRHTAEVSALVVQRGVDTALQAGLPIKNPLKKTLKKPTKSGFLDFLKKIIQTFLFETDFLWTNKT